MRKTLVIKELESRFDISIMTERDDRIPELHHLADFEKTLGAMTLMMGAIRSAYEALMLDDLMVDGYSDYTQKMVNFLRQSGMVPPADAPVLPNNVVPLHFGAI